MGVEVGEGQMLAQVQLLVGMKRNPNGAFVKVGGDARCRERAWADVAACAAQEFAEQEVPVPFQVPRASRAAAALWTWRALTARSCWCSSTARRTRASSSGRRWPLRTLFRQARVRALSLGTRRRGGSRQARTLSTSARPTTARPAR